MKALRPSLYALPYMQDLSQLNGLIQQVSADARGSKILRDYMMSVEGNKLSQEQLDMMNSVACKVINASQECTIALQNLECLGFLTQLKRETHPYRLIGSAQFGTLGHEFYVNTEELRLTARAYFYDDDQWLAEIQQHSAQYNMALSYTYAQQLFLVGHRDLVLAVGKTRLRESVRQRELVLGNHALATSLFNLVVQDDIKDVVKNAGVRDGTQNRLAKLIMEVASPLCARYKQDKLVGDVEMSDIILAFDVQQGEIELDYLGILLGALNTVSECDDFQVETLKQMDNQVLVPLIKALPRVRSQQKLHQALSESAQNRLEVERRSAQLYITLVLQLFSLSVQVQMKVGQQVGAPSTNTEQDYMRVLADIVKIMGTQESNFLVGLKIIEQGFGLLSPQNVSVFMKRQENPPIKVILNRYNSTNATLEERVRIIEFFVTYCRVEDGAEHLRQDSLLKALSLGSLMTAMNDADFYLTETPTSEPKRNPLHILWCHTLLLLRTLNHMLLPLSQEHRRLIPTQLSLIWTRLTALLGFGQALREQRFDSKSLSLALYEEMELMTGIVGQYMEYADELQANDWDRFVEVKDKIIFGVVGLFQEDRNISQNSSTEQYLLRMTHDKMQLGVLKQGAYSGLDLASDTLKVKIVFNTMSSLLNLNMLNENKASKQDFINTWDPTARLQAKNNDSRKSYYGENQYATDFDTGQALTNISLATHSLLQALTKLGDNFKLWLGSEALLSQLYDNVFSLFRNDDWINSEYMGLNTFIAGHTFADILEQYEQSLQMGYLSAAMFLKKLKEQYETSDFGGYQNILMNGQPINIKLINEHGDRIIEQTKVLEAEIVRNGKIKTSVDHGYNQKIEEFIRGLRENPYDYGGGGFMSKSRSKYGGASAYK
ncbi:hypothetical protein FGO68_gene15190 [Halteria grandinella]|uniref:Uncharacterized protein n=1 Tax=Halteria grandinella TaxID=5974 RepID=A0A8J8NGB3_HALGN|nr:hypothetical protein FGO68_gene15190 [Halteria grandinella]